MKGCIIVFLLVAGLLARLGFGEDSVPDYSEFQTCARKCWDDYKKCIASILDGKYADRTPPCWRVLKVCDKACEKSTVSE
ncbi:hypothetical protein LSAT2_008297 [Lamellibrachia satsuma]|nr:hypothetical protein LSAT2_008297 [Lamellibrachia satsuma]